MTNYKNKIYFKELLMRFYIYTHSILNMTIKHIAVNIDDFMKGLLKMKKKIDIIRRILFWRFFFLHKNFYLTKTKYLIQDSQ